jgi:hypothetical protein
MIELRQGPEAPYIDAGMAVDPEAAVHNQARGKEWEYRVIPVNEAGKGEPSNSVMAVS